jgi:hypothetical protein
LFAAPACIEVKPLVPLCRLSWLSCCTAIR